MSERKEKKPSLGELQAQANGGGGNGICCGRCGSRMSVLRVRQKQNRVERIRECHHCGNRVPTIER